MSLVAASMANVVQAGMKEFTSKVFCIGFVHFQGSLHREKNKWIGMTNLFKNKLMIRPWLPIELCRGFYFSLRKLPNHDRDHSLHRSLVLCPSCNSQLVFKS